MGTRLLRVGRDGRRSDASVRLLLLPCRGVRVGRGDGAEEEDDDEDEDDEDEWDEMDDEVEDSSVVRRNERLSRLLAGFSLLSRRCCVVSVRCLDGAWLVSWLMWLNAEM